MEEINQDKLEKIIGKELKYNQLCKELNLPYKNSNSKKAQLKDLELYCNLQVLSNPTRYVVEEIYDLKKLGINGNNKFQEYLEDLIIRFLRESNFKVMYITNTQLLMSLYMVNNNYKILKIPQKRKALESVTNQDFYNLYLAANKSGEILTKWVDRTLTRMEKRGLINYDKEGYCLFKRLKDDRFQTYQVPKLPTEKEGIMTPFQKVKGCYEQALNRYGVGDRRYVFPEYKEGFHDEFNRLIQEEFERQWDGGYKVKIITPTDPKRVSAFQESKTLVNNEAQRKIEETTQLDWLTGVERKKLLDEIISISPSVKYKDLIKKAQNK